MPKPKKRTRKPISESVMPKQKAVELEWNPENFQRLADEFNQLADELKSRIGPEDVEYIKKVKKLSKMAEIVGRTLIHIAIEPVTLTLGVCSLWLHHQLETTEIGHAALHGSWDGLEGAGEFQSDKFKWKCPVDEKAWRREHNILHHQFTNIIGRDPDLNYGHLRSSEKVDWDPLHLVQLTQFLFTAPFFLWTINFYANGLTDLFHPVKKDSYAEILPDRSLKTMAGALYQSAKKMVSYGSYNFVLWPMLAGPFWWKVLFANLTADAMRNVYSWATIYAGHFGDDLEYYDCSFKPKGRGEWYKMQVEAAHDYEVPHFLSVLSGALDRQIEHHLFPKLPPNRLREIAPKVEEICKKYGLKYNKAGWGDNLWAAARRLARMSLPSKQVPVPAV